MAVQHECPSCPRARAPVSWPSQARQLAGSWSEVHIDFTLPMVSMKSLRSLGCRRRPTTRHEPHAAHILTNKGRSRLVPGSLAGKSRVQAGACSGMLLTAAPSIHGGTCSAGVRSAYDDRHPGEGLLKQVATLSFIWADPIFQF
jgi:hypothetical protein